MHREEKRVRYRENKQGHGKDSHDLSSIGANSPILGYIAVSACLTLWET